MKRRSANGHKRASTKRRRIEDTEATTAYTTEYRPLDEATREIRLLVLEPGVDLDPIRCTLKHASLLDDPKTEYRTISYVWGDATNRGEIFIAGRKTDVPASTERVLRRMRLQSDIRVLWIDAVCINQADLGERSWQVAMMGKIYANGIENLIWLGEGDRSTRALLEHMQDILADFAADMQNFESLEDTLCNNGGFSFSSEPPRLSVFPRQLAKFFSTPWFKRLWVIQEARLAMKNACFCGEHELAFRDLVQVIAWLVWKQKFLQEFWLADVQHLYSFLLLAGKWTSYNHYSGEGISGLSRSLRMFEATDRRDYIFGAVGLHEKLIGPFPRALEPDYTVAWEMLFTKLVRHSIRETGRLNDLRLISRRVSDATTSLPSWVPHFDRNFDGDEDCAALRTDFGGFLDTWKPAVLHDDTEKHDQTCLALEGILLSDTVVYQNIAVGQWTDVQEKLECLSVIEAAASSISAKPDTVLIKIAHTLCAGIGIDYRNVDDKDSESAYMLYKNFLREHNDYPRWEYVADFRTEVEYNEATLNACHNRAFFMTSEGRMGLGPKLLQQGDVLAVLFGDIFPAVLRPSVAHPGDFEFMGFAYVYGVMRCEVLNEHVWAGKEPDIIRLW